MNNNSATLRIKFSHNKWKHNCHYTAPLSEETRCCWDDGDTPIGTHFFSYLEMKTKRLWLSGWSCLAHWTGFPLHLPAVLSTMGSPPGPQEIAQQALQQRSFCGAKDRMRMP